METEINADGWMERGGKKNEIRREPELWEKSSRNYEQPDWRTRVHVSRASCFSDASLADPKENEHGSDSKDSIYGGALSRRTFVLRLFGKHVTEFDVR